MSVYRKMKLGPYLSLCTNNSNWIKNFNVKPETWKTTKGLQDIDIDKKISQHNSSSTGNSFIN